MRQQEEAREKAEAGTTTTACVNCIGAHGAGFHKTLLENDRHERK